MTPSLWTMSCAKQRETLEGADGQGTHSTVQTGVADSKDSKDTMKAVLHADSLTTLILGITFGIFSAGMPLRHQ